MALREQTSHLPLLSQTTDLTPWEATPELILVLNACWQAQFGGKVNKKERKM